MVYATVIGDNVEALLGYHVILVQAYLQNSRKVIRHLLEVKLFGTCMISNGLPEAFQPDDWVEQVHY